MTRKTINYPAQRVLTERYQCMDCGHVGVAADLRSHADLDGCRNFRITTAGVSSTGRILDERVEPSSEPC